MHSCNLGGLLFQLDANILVRVKVNIDSPIFHLLLDTQASGLEETRGVIGPNFNKTVDSGSEY